MCSKVEIFLGKEVREARADGGGEHARRRNKKARDFMHFLTHKSALLSRRIMMRGKGEREKKELSDKSPGSVIF